MLNEKLNSLAERAKEGCSSSFEEIIKHFLPKIHSLRRLSSCFLTDESAFEWSCFQRIRRAISKFDPLRHKSFERIVSADLMATQRTYYLRAKRSSHVVVYLEEHSTRDKEGNTATYEESLLDVLANVESSVVAKEMIALLAEGDPKREAILIAWCDGCFNDSKISELLAQLFGGNIDTHRKAIQRFRKHCKAVLAKSA